MTDHKTLVLGASLNPARASHQAVQLLTSLGHDVIAVGRRAGSIGDVEIQIGQPNIDSIDTLTLYIGKDKQTGEVTNYLLSLAPKRVIFNPGTENLQTIATLQAAGIQTERACTLVLLRTGQYEATA